MKFSTQAKKIQQALSRAQLMTTRQSSLEVLQGVFIGVTEEGGVVRATNLHIGIEAKFPGQVDSVGSCVCDATLLLGVVGSVAGDETITCEVVETTLHITTPHSQTTIKLLNAEDFPSLPHIDSSEKISVRSVDLIHGLQSVVYAASASDIKPQISSVYIYLDDAGSLVCVSTDSFRLAEKKIPTISSAALEGVMVPVKNAQVLMRVFSDTDEVVDIHFSDSQMTFTTQNYYCVTRLVDGNYPAYQNILPKEFVAEATFLKSDILTTLKTLNVFADKFYQIDIVVDGEKNITTLSSHHPERGNHTAELPCMVEGESLDMRCNARYLQDGLGAITTESVVLKFVATNKPFIVAPVGEYDFQYLVMPLNR
ncbi:DNA polymerase III subunit beta [Candidatus Nomurabacteria bacterium]|nr:DNA polymerase III subunit beta [Candidatus Nomurabacteria bacterium]